MPSSQQLHPGVHCSCHLGWGDYNSLQSPKPAKEREGIPCWSPGPREQPRPQRPQPLTRPAQLGPEAPQPRAASQVQCPCAQMRKGDSWSRLGALCCREAQQGEGRGPQRPGPAHVEWRARMEHAKGPRTVALLRPLERRAPRCVFGSAVNKTQDPGHSGQCHSPLGCGGGGSLESQSG